MTENAITTSNNQLYGSDHHSPSVMDSEMATVTNRDQNVQDYEALLQESLNLENLPNKLYVKKSLIAQAVGKAKPKMKRLFA